MRRHCISCLLLSFIFPSVLPAAAEPVTTHLEEEAVVVVASRLEQPRNEVGSSVAVLFADELLARDVRFVADALQEVPSLIVSSQGPRGSQTQVRVRGNEANHVLVLIDGVRVSNASTGEYDLANLSLEGIEKIEILLGSQSTLYGSDAAAGVISITTRRGSEGFAGRVRLGAGSLGTNSQSVHVGDAQNAWHYAITASRYETTGISAADEDNGNTEKDGYESRALTVKTGYQKDDVHTWISFNDSHSRYEFDDEDYVTGLAIDDAQRQQWVDTRSLSWVAAFPSLAGRLQHRLQLARAYYDYESYSGSTYLTETERDSLGYQGDFAISERQTLSFGIEKVTDALTAALFSVDRELDVTGTYLQWLGGFGHTDVSAGVRNDRHDEFGDHQTYRLTASHRLNGQWRLRAAYGTGFKAPGLLDLYMPAGWGGNPDLQPEESSSVEVGAEFRAGGYHTSLTLFDQETDRLIRCVGAYPCMLENVDKANSRGVELNLGRKIDDLDVNASLAWLDATETQDGVTAERQRVPEWAGSLLASYDYSAGRLWMQALYRSDRRDRNYYTAQDVTLQAYWLLHIGMSYELGDDATLSARIDNLLDKDYEEAYSYGTRGRTVTVGLDWRF